MDNPLYEMIFKRKSFHLFRNTGETKITEDELSDIKCYINKLEPLYPDIKTEIKIVKDGTTCKRGQEYCILFYSEHKDGYLQNIGYIGEQLDLYLVSKDIGSLWFGIGRVEEKELDGLEYVIMIAIKKVDSSDKFRKDMFKSKRKDLNEIWTSPGYLDIANIVRFAPSACNSQPWFVEGDEKEIKIFRKSSRRGIMPKGAVKFYNQIDIGIFIYFLDLCFSKNMIKYIRTLYYEKNSNELVNLNAIYKF